MTQKQFSEQLDLTREQYYELNRPFLTLKENRFVPDDNSLIIALKNFGQTAAVDSIVRVFYHQRDSKEEVNILSLPRLPIGTFYPNEEIFFSIPRVCPFAEQMSNRTFNIHVEYRFQDKCVRYKMPYRVQESCGFTSQSREEEPCD